MDLKALMDLKELLSTDSFSTTRLTTNDNFAKLKTGISALIDSLGVNAGPDIDVNSVTALDITGTSFDTPNLKFQVNSNGEIIATSILGNVVVETPRLRLDPDPTLIAFQAGEIRWSGSDFVGWDGTQWISFTAGASGGEANTASNVGTGVGLFKTKTALDLRFKSLSGVSGVTIDDISDPDTIIISSTPGTSGFSGINGTTGTSGYSGFSGNSGYSGFSGKSGFSGYSGARGLSGFSGVATSGYSGASGSSTSGYSGFSGKSGFSGYSGESGTSGVSGFSGDQGIQGLIGPDGASGFSGYSGIGLSGFSGTPSPPILGPAEDGSYIDGFWTDLTPSTPVGTFADRVNEIMLSLLPPPAPNLSDWSQLTLALSVPGKLSFDSLDVIPGYLNADSATPPVFVDGLFDTTGKRIGITQQIGGTKLSGVLNYQITLGPGAPSPAYPAQTFGDAEKGYLKLYLNGVEIVPKRIDLTSTTSAIDTSTGGTVTGMSVGTQGTVLFPNGAPLSSFKYRTGTWTFIKSDLSLGYNYIQIKHEVSLADIRSLAVYEVVVDGDTTATSYSGETIFNPIMGTPKKISGIEYHQSGTLKYNITINNAYRNTYSSSASAISHTGNSNTYGVLLTAAAQALGPNSGNEALAVSILNKTATVSSPGKRVINGSLSLTTSTLRTVQGTVTSSGSSLPSFLIDNVSATSTVLFEGFDDEAFRLNTLSNYNLVADVTTGSNVWDSIQSLKDGSSGHTDGLQVIDGKLIYPGANVSYPLDFRTSNIVNGSTFNDGGTGGTGRNYTGLAGTRYFIRKFQQISPTTGNFIMTITGTGGTFVPVSTSLTGTNIHVEVKGPSQTGWMDAYNDFVTASWADGDGARSAANGAGRAFATAWGLTIGTKNTAFTGGYMLVRISVGASFTGSFDSITYQFV